MAEQHPRITADQATITDVGSHLEPRLRVALGETFVIETQDNAFNSVLSDGAPDFTRPPFASPQFPVVNPVGGPVFIDGVAPGDTLVVEILGIDVRDWGWTGVARGFGPFAGKTGWEDLQEWATVIRHEPGPSGTLADGEAVMNLDRESRWPLAPFIGTLMVAPARGIENTLVSQGAWGGNIDVRDIRVGSRVHLNVGVEGALLFAGDVHASQGDSELGGNADETAATLTLRCHVIKDRAFPGVARIETAHSLIQCASMRMEGGGEVTIERAYIYMIDWLTSEYGMSKQEALAHMSANSGVRGHIYQASSGFLVVGVEFPKSSL